MGSDSNGLERADNGRFTVGNKASAGRPNPKFSTKVKDALVAFLELNIDKVQESFDQLKPLEKLQFVANILPYIVPKMSSVQSENNHKLSGGINIRWEDPDLHAGQNQSPISNVQSLQNGREVDNPSGGHPLDKDVWNS